MQNHGAAKRKKELLRQEKQREKEAQRVSRKKDKEANPVVLGEDRDLSAMAQAPQPPQES